MKPENLENLLYYYMQANREYDDIDSPVPQGSLSAECDNPITPFHFDGSNYENLPHHFVPNMSPPIAFHFAPLSAEQRAKASIAGRKLSEMTSTFLSNQPDRSGIKFKSSCLFVTPEKQTVSVPITRQPGYEDVPLKIKWKTYDKTAVSGTHYVGSAGEIILEKGEMEKEFKVEILTSKADGDLRFQVEFTVENSVFAPKSMVINIKKHFDSQEQLAVENLIEQSPTSAIDVLFFLQDNLSTCTFHSGLSYVCSKADSLPLEFGLAFQLSMLCLKNQNLRRRLRYESVFNILKDFFRLVELPEEFDF